MDSESLYEVLERSKDLLHKCNTRVNLKGMEHYKAVTLRSEKDLLEEKAISGPSSSRSAREKKQEIEEGRGK